MFLPDVKVVRQAAAALGWDGDPVQVRFGGEDAWALASLTNAHLDATPNTSALARVDGSTVDVSAVRIAGVIVAGRTTSHVVTRASVFAGYSPRAVLVPDGPRVLAVQVAAAMLGQGVVVVSERSARLLSPAEPTQLWSADAAEAAQHRLRERVHASLVAAGASPEVG
ncbi:hypothetical protein [Naumannella huperziae]